MSLIDQRAEHWRQEQEIRQTAMALERQAKRDQEQRRKPRALRLDSRMPTWQKWIVYPVGLWILWDCFRVVFLGGRMR